MKLNKQDKELLDQAAQVKEMSQHKGWAEVLEPWLKAKRDQSFPDPAEISDKDKFYHAAVSASMFKKVVAEILVFVDDQTKTYNHLIQKQMNKLEKNKFNIGGKT